MVNSLRKRYHNPERLQRERMNEKKLEEKPTKKEQPRLIFEDDY